MKLFLLWWLASLLSCCLAPRSLSDLDPILVPLLCAAQKQSEKIDTKLGRYLDAGELFSGEEAITQNCAESNIYAMGFDKVKGDDIMTKAGYKKAMHIAMSIRRGGCLWAAPECSSWVWISRGRGGRSKEWADGMVTDDRIDYANRLVSRVTQVLLLAWSRGVHIFLEQPVSSVMNYFSPLKEFILSCLVFATITWLGSYGSISN